jgi:hypothetical protein
MTTSQINPLSNFPRGFKNGVNIRGLPLLQTHPGRVLWVCNRTNLTSDEVGGSDTGRGTFQRPFATIARALLACTAGIGDIIMVKAGHAEAINDATTLALNVAGVAIVGQGYGSNRPTLTFGAAAANIPITAADMSIQNFLFKANFADVASVFTATGTATPTDLSIQNCAFRDGASNLNFLSIITGNATANSLDGLTYVGNKRTSLGTTAATTDIKILSDTARIEITDNSGVYAVLNDTAALLAASTFQLTAFYLGRNVASRPNTSSTGGSFISGSGNAWTGMAFDNYFYQVDNSAGIWISTGHGSAFGYSNNFSPITGAVDKSALINPAAV